MSHNLRSVVTIILLYLLFSVSWILFTDQLAHLVEARYGLPQSIETYKGLAFVVINGLWVFWLLHREIRSREADFQKHLREKEALFEQLKAKNDELLEAYDKTIFGWSRVLEMRNREIKDHSKRVTELSVLLSRSLGLSEERVMAVRRGALLHDIGKMAIPDDIILKNGHLDVDERAVVQKHPLFGFEMLSEIEYLRPAMDLILCHHEKWNGEGYPFGLAGDQIPLEARIFAVVDVWDALRSERPYHQPEPPSVAMDYLKREAGEHFDPDIVEAFLRMLNENPRLARLQDEDDTPFDVGRINKDNGNGHGSADSALHRAVQKKPVKIAKS